MGLGLVLLILELYCCLPALFIFFISLIADLMFKSRLTRSNKYLVFCLIRFNGVLLPGTLVRSSKSPEGSYQPLFDYAVVSHGLCQRQRCFMF